MKTPPIIVETVINAPVAKVWDAMTHKRQMKHWYFDIPDFVAEYGAEFEWYAGPEGKQYLHKGKITEMLQEQKIGYDWKYEGVEGDSHVTFELRYEGEHTTKVRVIHTGTETFPTYDANFSRESFEGGWQQILTGLKGYVEA